jgi:hypothetical protein
MLHDDPIVINVRLAGDPDCYPDPATRWNRHA